MALIKKERKEVYEQTLKEIKEARDAMDLLVKNNIIREPDSKLLEEALQKAIAAVS